MKKLTPLFLLVALFIIGCQPSQDAINTAIAQTQAVTPTNTSAPSIIPTLSLTEIKIDPNIFQPENLGLVAGKVKNEIPEIGPFSRFRSGDVQLSRELLSPNKKIYTGWVSIIFYESSDYSQHSVKYLRTKLDELKIKYEDKKIGDDGVLYKINDNYYFSGIAFCRDNYFVSVYINDNAEIDNFDLGTLSYYAESIDSRIQAMLGK